MHGVVIVFLASFAMFSVFQWSSVTDRFKPAAEKAAHIGNEYDLYKIFVRHAVAYMKANPAASGTVYWPAIASSLALPPAMAGTGMPATWRIVSDGSTYVLCTEMKNEETPSYLSRTLMERPEKLNRVNGKWVVGDPSNPTQLTTEAAKCT